MQKVFKTMNFFGPKKNPVALSYTEVIQKFPKIVELACETDQRFPSEDLFAKCCEFIKDAPALSSSGTQTTAHELKVIAERQVGYVSNGAMMLACVAMNFPVRISDGHLFVGVVRGWIRGRAKESNVWV